MDYHNFKPTVNVSLETIIRECSLDPHLNQNHFFNFSLYNRENVHKVFRYKKFNDDFTKYLTCYNDGNYFIGTFRPCYEEFLYKLQVILNVPPKNSTVDDENLTKELNARLEVLKRITTHEELKKEFPLLYRDLTDGRSFIDEIERMIKKYPEDNNRYKKQRDYYYSCALKRGLINFINTQAEMYRRFINDRQKYKAQIEQTSYNNYLRTHFDMNKLAMYVTHEYLCICESTKDPEVIKYYLSLIDKYLNDPEYKKNVTLTTKDGIVLNEEMINQRIRNLRRQLSDNSSLVNWVILPEGQDYSRVHAPKKSKVKETIFNYEELKRLRQKGQSKQAFYESTDYLAKAVGLLKYRGYCAFIYKNGKVVLDREYDTSHPKSATGDAIYIIDSVDFETLSKLDKATLKKQRNVQKINHTNNWQERIKKIISEETTKELEEAGNELIKLLREKIDRG